MRVVRTIARSANSDCSEDRRRGELKKEDEKKESGKRSAADDRKPASSSAKEPEKKPRVEEKKDEKKDEKKEERKVVSLKREAVKEGPMPPPKADVKLEGAARPPVRQLTVNPAAAAAAAPPTAPSLAEAKSVSTGRRAEEPKRDGSEPPRVSGSTSDASTKSESEPAAKTRKIVSLRGTSRFPANEGAPTAAPAPAIAAPSAAPAASTPPQAADTKKRGRQ